MIRMGTRIAPFSGICSCNSCSSWWGAQPPRLLFGAPSRRTAPDLSDGGARQDTRGACGPQMQKFHRGHAALRNLSRERDADAVEPACLDRVQIGDGDLIVVGRWPAESG